MPVIRYGVGFGYPRLFERLDVEKTQSRQPLSQTRTDDLGYAIFPF
jgi:hypothetical protein